jgi:hypothetical protein
MLIVVYPGIPHGHQFKAGEELVQGTVGYISGMNTSGYYTIKAPSNSTTAAVAVYPFKKYYCYDDLSDTADAVNKIASGDPLVVFQGGEYLTDKFIGIGGSTSDAYFRNAYYMDVTANPIVVTDTAGYTSGIGNGSYGKPVYLWPSTAASYKGYLRVATANDGTKVTGSLPNYNKNFQLVRAYTGSWTGNNKIQFRVVASDFNGRYFTGVSTAAWYVG